MPIFQWFQAEITLSQVLHGMQEVTSSSLVSSTFHKSCRTHYLRTC